MRNPNLHLDDNFFKVHPDLAALFREIREKENAIKRLKARKAMLKGELKSSRKEFEKRLAVLETWEKKGEMVAKPARKS